MAMLHIFQIEEDENRKIIIHDDVLFANLNAFLAVTTFWGSDGKNPKKGLNYCGYTYISPENMDDLFNAVCNIYGIEQLADLALKAKEENKWIEHLGL